MLSKRSSQVLPFLAVVQLLVPAMSRTVVAPLSAQAPAAAGSAQAPAQTARAAPAGAGQVADIDAFMARVLERRDETWRKLHDYVLDETEQFRIVGPGGVPLHGMKRDFTWYVRDGFLVRSPLKYDGVTVGESDRRAYEQKWLEQEKRREERAAKKAAERADAQSKPGATKTPPADGGQEQGDTKTASEGEPSLQEFVSQRGEPRFISEAYFLRFKFEPGNYYFAGRDTLDGRPVVKIEYYPTKLFQDDHEHDRGEDQAGAGAGGEKDKRNAKDKQKQKAEDEEYGRKFNKVALVTLWVDPAEYQIVRYTFDNMDFGFLPGRWLVRLDDIRASMTMARVLDGVWLPAAIEMRGGLSLASGAYRFEYDRRFANYKKAETGARIRNMTPRDR